MLLLNCIWDMLSALTIWWSFCIKDVADHAFIEGAVPKVVIITSDDETDSLFPSSTSCNNNNTCRNNTSKSQRSLFYEIASMHTSMWTRQADATNPAACILMAWWVLTLGFMRIMGVYNEIYLVISAASYALEGIAFLVEGLKATMIPKKACPASLFSFCCLAVCLNSMQ